MSRREVAKGIRKALSPEHRRRMIGRVRRNAKRLYFKLGRPITVDDMHDLYKSNGQDLVKVMRSGMGGIFRTNEWGKVGHPEYTKRDINANGNPVHGHFIQHWEYVGVE